MRSFFSQLGGIIGVTNIAATNLTGLFFATIHLVCLSSLSPDRFHLNLLISLLGGLVGWILGNITSPTNEDEKKSFSQLGAAISTFLSGYVVSKLDRFLEKALFGSDQINQNAWTSASFFTSALIIVTLTVFLNRFYALKLDSNTPSD
jgi:hypothetical protein